MPTPMIRVMVKQRDFRGMLRFVFSVPSSAGMKLSQSIKSSTIIWSSNSRNDGRRTTFKCACIMIFRQSTSLGFFFWFIISAPPSGFHLLFFCLGLLKFFVYTYRFAGCICNCCKKTLPPISTLHQTMGINIEWASQHHNNSTIHSYIPISYSIHYHRCSFMGRFRTTSTHLTWRWLAIVMQQWQ